MTITLMLEMLKIDLGITSQAYDERLAQYILYAVGQIAAEGADIAVNAAAYDIEDAQLIVMYAAWLWRNRDTMAAMPRMLRWALNNRVLSGKMSEVQDGND